MKFAKIGSPILLLLAAALWLVVGCESESVAPHDELPELTASDVAAQAGYTAATISQVGPYIFEDLTPGTKDPYSYSFPEGGDGEGTVYFDCFLGAVPSTYEDADNVDMYTATDENITFNFELDDENVVSMVLTFNLHAEPFNDDPPTATVTGSGTIDFGSYAGDFEIDQVVLDGSEEHPEDGELIFTIDDMTATVTYDGDNTATVTITTDDGTETYSINLDTGEITS